MVKKIILRTVLGTILYVIIMKILDIISFNNSIIEFVVFCIISMVVVCSVKFEKS